MRDKSMILDFNLIKKRINARRFALDRRQYRPDGRNRNRRRAGRDIRRYYKIRNNTITILGTDSPRDSTGYEKICDRAKTDKEGGKTLKKVLDRGQFKHSKLNLYKASRQNTNKKPGKTDNNKGRQDSEKNTNNKTEKNAKKGTNKNSKSRKLGKCKIKIN